MTADEASKEIWGGSMIYVYLLVAFFCGWFACLGWKNMSDIAEGRK